ncbi:DUF1801 domain-containing protein [Winogradskyella sediminis]|uniref:YdhG-like domain-containing protein n=1 Tax=Winogradskyella sediminis TaxID=1382466 RepID=A0A1H1NVM3_9FLAO|nr:DUF1801 domain-containing protein [Winogradskyella sediminis]REG90232.1 hypothetical protein C8N41_1011483 [Winogradskyella sediminis]SDS02825.1 hypothetical protein SAMN04489797_0703 [Winogradskyella sediminis]
MNPAEAHILNQPEPFKSIFLHLQVLIEHTLPEADLLYKWRMPCYYVDKRPICYLNKSKDYVDVGFWHSAHLLKQWDAYLISENRKVVKSLRYKTLDDIDDAVFISILKEVEGLKEKGFYKKG